MAAPIKLEPGQELEFKIIKMNPAEKKVGLSIRAVGEEATRADVEAYKAPAATLFGRRFHHRRVHVVEARQQRKQLVRSNSMQRKAASDGGLCF